MRNFIDIFLVTFFICLFLRTYSLLRVGNKYKSFMQFIISLAALLAAFSFSIWKNSIFESWQVLDEGSSHGAIFPLTEKTPQWNPQMRSRIIKIWKGGNKERWVLRRWIHQMSFKNISSRLEKRMFFNGVTGKDKGKGFGREYFQSFFRVQKRIQHTPRKWHQNIIAEVVCWENPNPTTKMVTT